MRERLLALPEVRPTPTAAAAAAAAACLLPILRRHPPLPCHESRRAAMVQVLRVSGVHGTIRYELDTSYGEELRLPFQPATFHIK